MKSTRVVNCVLFLLTVLLSIALGTNFISPSKVAAGCNRFDITCNPHVKPITRPVAEKAWGESGATGYQAAARVMRERNRGGQALNERQKSFLKPYFGGIVDQVLVSYNAKMMSEWCAFGKCVNLGGVESAAQTYCNNIYVRDSYKPNDRNQALLLAHELVHTRQCQQLGGSGKFGYHYFEKYKKVGQNYENNSLEQEARNVADQIARTGTF